MTREKEGESTVVVVVVVVVETAVVFVDIDDDDDSETVEVFCRDSIVEIVLSSSTAVTSLCKLEEERVG